MFCRKCGKKLLPDSKICDKCGTEVSAEMGEDATSIEPVIPEPVTPTSEPEPVTIESILSRKEFWEPEPQWLEKHPRMNSEYIEWLSQIDAPLIELSEAPYNAEQIAAVRSYIATLVEEGDRLKVMKAGTNESKRKGDVRVLVAVAHGLLLMGEETGQSLLDDIVHGLNAHSGLRDEPDPEKRDQLLQKIMGERLAMKEARKKARRGPLARFFADFIGRR